MIYGLTGGIAMGKSTLSRQFVDRGVPVWDADESVHRLYRENALVQNYVQEIHPEAWVDGAVDRSLLSRLLFADDDALERINGLIIPLVVKDAREFVESLKGQMGVLDAPLLFESGLNKLCDRVISVSCSPYEQRDRALARPGMTEEKLSSILRKQWTDFSRRANSNFVVYTDGPIDENAVDKFLVDENQLVVQEKSMNENLYLYVMVRSDMVSMKAGKGAAQAVHAGNQFTDEHVIRPLLEGKTPNADVMEWRTHADGFGTTIALDAPSLRDMQAVVATANALGFPANVVVDPSYPYIVPREWFEQIPDETHTVKPVDLGNGTFLCFRKEITTAYLFGDKTKLEVLLKRFKLMNND